MTSWSPETHSRATAQAAAAQATLDPLAGHAAHIERDHLHPPPTVDSGHDCFRAAPSCRRSGTDTPVPTHKGPIRHPPQPPRGKRGSMQSR